MDELRREGKVVVQSSTDPGGEEAGRATMTRSKGGVVLLDGPAAGRYSVGRAPHWLRAVVSRTDGTRDLLDQLHDTPRPVEAVYVYETAGPTWSAESARLMGMIICPPPGAMGEYRHRADVDGEALRETAAWRSWCRAQPLDHESYDPLTGRTVPAGEVSA
ncbi:MAG: hypothetical protein C0498_01430 [Anaerolinea sp.]|nr:hypothetical protein [Anaerolinea sp.]